MTIIRRSVSVMYLFSILKILYCYKSERKIALFMDIKNISIHVNYEGWMKQ